MCPARKSAKKEPKKPKSPVRKERDVKVKDVQQRDTPQIKLIPGVGWNPDNFNYLKTVAPEKLGDCIYKMFDIPLLYKTDEKHAAIRIFVEFHCEVFEIAKQFTDIYKSMKVIALLSDYIASVPAFSSSKDSFSEWCQRAIAQIENGDFAPTEVQMIEQYIEKNLRANAHVLHFVLTSDIVKRYDQEGLKLFRSVVEQKKEEEGKDEKDEVPETVFILDESLNEARLQKEREIQEQIREYIEQKYEEIQELLERRNDQLLEKIMRLEESIDPGAKKRKPTE